MVLDGHIHIRTTDAQPRPFLNAMREAGVDGGIVLSAFPPNMAREAAPYGDRIRHVTALCREQPLLFPFFFLDPTEDDALAQVDAACEAGIAGFKIICTHFYPSDPRCLPIYRRIAERRKPVLFHSGILWNGLVASGNFNKPTEFEVLLTIPRLRFALAHISWPWTDECTAVYGKFNNATLGTLPGDPEAGEIFIDNTPGTPKIYREDALKRLLFAGYEVLQNLYFGADNFVEDYNVAWARDWIATDWALYEAFGLNEAEIEGIFSRNLLRFVEMRGRSARL